jgi:hypothetical protein
MIVAETDDGYRLVTQPDHAALVGQFADRWGNDAFAAPEPSPAVAIAAHTHDDGWWARDRRPYLCEDGTPENFTEIDADPWIALYDEGTASVIELDRYAGLLVSMHGSGLRRRRYGRSPSWPATPEPYREFVDRQEERQRELAASLYDDGDDRIDERDLEVLDALHEYGEPPDDPGSRIWRNYELLQAWDTLSLSFCTTTSPPSYDPVGPVPTRDGDRTEQVSIRARGNGRYEIAPYPFDVDPLVASVPTRTVEGRSFETEAASVRAFYAGDRGEISLTLQSPGS